MFDKISVCSFSFSGLKCFVVENRSDCQNHPKNLWNSLTIIPSFVNYCLFHSFGNLIFLLSLQGVKFLVKHVSEPYLSFAFEPDHPWMISASLTSWMWRFYSSLIKYFEKRFVKIISCGVSTCNNHNIYTHFINSLLTGWLIIKLNDWNLATFDLSVFLITNHH